MTGSGERARESDHVKAGYSSHPLQLFPSPTVPHPAGTPPSAHLGAPSARPSQEEFLQEGSGITLSENTGSRSFQHSISVPLRQRPGGAQGLASTVNVVASFFKPHVWTCNL